MDVLHFYGMEFLKPVMDTAPGLSWYSIVFSLMVFLAVLQASVSVFSVFASGDLRFMRGNEYRQHILFLVSQLLALTFVGVMAFLGPTLGASPQFLFYCFSLLLAYFGVSALALYFNVSTFIVAMVVSIGLIMCGIATLHSFQAIMYSFGLIFAAIAHCVISLTPKATFNSHFIAFYRVCTILVASLLVMQEIDVMNWNPIAFSFLLFATGIAQWLLTMASLWSNYERSIDDRDKEQRDYAEEGKRKLEAIFLDLHDEVTGCPNDSYLVNYLNSKVASGDINTFALFCVRVRGLRPVQNALGLDTANGLLKACAQRLAVIGHALNDFIVISDHENSLGCVIRSEGREFFMISKSVAPEAINRYCAKINETFSVPFEYSGLCLDLQANIGVALYPTHGHRPQQVMQQANVAVDIAKRGSYGSVLFDPLLDPSVQRRLILLGDLRSALNRGDIFMTYQPQVCLATNQVLGVEALIRWNHPFLGAVPPDEFITLAEQTGVIKHISRWVCDHAAMDFVHLNLEGFCLKMSVNVSPNNLLEESFAPAVLAILEEHNIPPGCFYVELTETAVMLDLERVMASIEHMSHHGVVFSIDDFGTGFSSLVNLKRLKVKQLKIDKGFIANLEFDTEDEAIVRATIEMANCLGLETVAEGVETLAVLEKLRILECNIIQGFYVSKSMPIDELIEWLASRPNQTQKIKHLVS